MRYYEVTPFDFELTPEIIAEAAQTLPGRSADSTAGETQQDMEE